MRAVDADPLPDLGLRPLTARSVVLSALLGSHPPRLPVRALVAYGQQFDISEAAVRTALSRMVGAGEVSAVDGSYVLGERLRRRQAVQDIALHAPAEPWDGAWWLVTVEVARRSVADRRAFRGTLLEHRFGELRPDTWLRPANVPAPDCGPDVLVVRGSVADRSPVELARRLWDVDDLRATGDKLLALAVEACTWVEEGDPDLLSRCFLASIAIVRYLRAEPRLPATIVGPGWPSNELRHRYARLVGGQQALLRTLLR